MNDLTPNQDANLLKLAQRTVGFLIQKRDGDSDILYLAPAGSGTMASIKGQRFLITAGHVADAFMKSNLAGVFSIMAPNRHLRPVEVDPKYCDAIIHWNGDHSPAGPDIAAIKLPPHITEQLAQNQIVYNLDLRAAIKDQIQPMEDLILTGFPAVKAKNVSTEEWQRRDMMTLSVTAGKHLPAELGTDGFDRYDFKAIYVTEPPPESFEGISGGGLWTLNADDPDTIPMLAGIAYYQSEKLEDGNRIITCAGAQSIYAKLLQDVGTKWIED